jgi:heptosyltransferase-2
MFQPIRKEPRYPQTETIVILPYGGFGDLIWHLPILRALAANDPSGQIDLAVNDTVPVGLLLREETFAGGYLALPLVQGGNKRRAARQMGTWQGLKYTCQDFWLRIKVFVVLLWALKRRKYQQAFILHHSPRFALAARLAGIPRVFGYGAGSQKFLLTQKEFLSKAERKIFALYRGRRLLDLIGIVHDGVPPALAVNRALAQEMAQAYADSPKPWVGFAIGSREELRLWPAERFAAVADALWESGQRSLFLFGAAHEAELAQAIIGYCRIAKPIAVTGRPLNEIIALLSGCAFTFCTDSGLMNISAAVGVPTYVLFATVQPYDHSPCLRPITPEGGIDMKIGARKISVETVLAALRADGRVLPSSPKPDLDHGAREDVKIKSHEPGSV